MQRREVGWPMPPAAPRTPTLIPRDAPDVERALRRIDGDGDRSISGRGERGGEKKLAEQFRRFKSDVSNPPIGGGPQR